MLEGMFKCKPTRCDPFAGIGRVGFFLRHLLYEVTYAVDNHADFAGDVGLGFGVAGNLVHLLLVVAVVVLILQLLQGRRVV